MGKDFRSNAIPQYLIEDQIERTREVKQSAQGHTETYPI